MQSSQIVSTQPKQTPVSRRPEVDARNRQAAPDEAGQSTDQAFDMLLMAMSQSQASFNSIQDVKSSETMFEPPGKQGTSNQSHQADDGRLSPNDVRQDARMDRTSFDSRKAGVDLKPQGSHTTAATSSKSTSSDFAARSLNSQGRISAERFSSNVERNVQSGRASHDGAASLTKDSVLSEPQQNELPRSSEKAIAAPASVAKASTVSASPTSNAAQQVAKILASGPTQASTTSRLTAGPATASLSRETTNARQTESAVSGQPASYEDVARTVNTRRPGAAAFEQLVQSIRMRSMAGRSSAQLQLNPPELGRIVVNVEMNGNDLLIDVHTETSEARDLLSERVTRLREALQGVGVHVDQFRVDADVEAMPDQQVGYQNTHENNEKPTTADRGSTFNRKASDVSNVRMISVSELPQEVRSDVSVAGIIDVKI